jgi:pimeloyl-ACP methyl ester carboxylesterase
MMTTVAIDGRRFECVERGTGAPVVLVHGSASDYRTWHSQLDALGERYRTIAYSRRYHWPNERIPEGVDYAMTEHVDDLQAFLHALQAAPFHLVGHSYGAFVCLLLAIREPGLVRTLVLAEPPVVTLFVGNPPRPSEILRVMLGRPRTGLAIMKFVARGAGPATAAARRGDIDAAMRIFGNAVLGRDFYARLSPSRLEQIRANAIGAEFLGSGFAPLDEDDVRHLTAPTLLASAQHSPSFFHRLIDRLGVLLPRAERVEIRDASHIMHEDNAPAFNAAVLSFLDAHRGA